MIDAANDGLLQASRAVPQTAHFFETVDVNYPTEGLVSVASPMTRHGFLVEGPAYKPFNCGGPGFKPMLKSEIVEALQKGRINDEVQQGFIRWHGTSITDTDYAGGHRTV